MSEPLEKVAAGDPLAIPAETFVKRPIAAYVEQVYPYGDFSLLGIGT